MGRDARRSRAHLSKRELSIIHDEAVGIDHANKRVLMRSGRPGVRFDVCSVDVGITPRASDVAGANEHATPVKPIFGFNARWEAMLARVLEGGKKCDVCVVGGGAGAPSSRCRCGTGCGKS